MQNMGGPAAPEPGAKAGEKEGEGQGFFDEAGALIDFKGAFLCVEPTRSDDPSQSTQKP